MLITLTGATGGIGSRLVRALVDRGDDVTVLARDPERAAATLPDVRAYAWDATDDTPTPVEALEDRDAVVNLAGAPITLRWTSENKALIKTSRVAGTRKLVDGLAAVAPERRPARLVSGSATGYYGDRRDGPLDEQAAPGGGFLADVCVAWEREAHRAQELGVRVAVLRTAGIVLDADEGAFPILRRVTAFGAGGPLGSGRQPFPWIHVDDEVGLLLHLIDSALASGPVNGVAPERLTQREFAGILGREMHRPAFLPAPAPAVRMLMGEQASLVLEGADVEPTAATQLGYRFAFAEARDAVRDLLRRGD